MHLQSLLNKKTVSQLINRVNMKEQPRQRVSHVLAPLSLLCLALAGCTVGPDFARPDVAANADYSKEKLTTTAQADIDTGGAAQRLIAGMDIPGQWWTLFRSPALNALVEEALKANPDVSAAQALSLIHI